MIIPLNYKDTITILDYTVDGYGKEVITETAQVGALFFQDTGFSHGTNQDAIGTNSYVYVDFNNQFIKDRWNRLEGMLVIAQPFGGEFSSSWYRITDVKIGIDKLLTNTIDNIVLGLSKTSEVAYVS